MRTKLHVLFMILFLIAVDLSVLLNIPFFRQFLGFETGGKAEGIRNVIDTYIKVNGNLKEKLLEIVKILIF